MASSNGPFIISVGDDPTVLVIPSIDPAEVLAHGTDYMSRELPVEDVAQFSVELEATGGDAACALDVEFHFEGSIDGQVWGHLVTIPLTLSGTDTVRTVSFITTEGVRMVRLGSIENKEAEAGRTATDVGARWGKSYPLL